MGFDSTTFFFELVNFGLLLWVLERVLYRPLREGIDRRRAALAAEHESAAEERELAQVLKAEAQARLAEIEKHRESVMADAREQAAKEEARILEHARQDAIAERERVQRTLEHERAEAIAWVREATVVNATEISGRLLQDLLSESADDVLTRGLLASLPDFREALQQEALSGVGAEGRLTAIFSAPRAPSNELRQDLERTLSELCPVPCDLEVREDPSLVAGPVLRVGDRVFDASVAGHLAVLRERARGLANELPIDG